MTTDREARLRLSQLLAQFETDEAHEIVHELRDLLANDCLHYGSVRRKFNGGRMSLYCNWCGFHIGDAYDGQMRLPASQIRVCKGGPPW